MKPTTALFTLIALGAAPALAAPGLRSSSSSVPAIAAIPDSTPHNPAGLTTLQSRDDDAALDRRYKNFGFMVYICTQAGWKGRCKHLELTEGDCLSLQVEPGYEGRVNSLGPDWGFECKVYDDLDCTQTSSTKEDGPKKEKWLQIEYPGIGDLRKKGWGNQIRSLKCRGTLTGTPDASSPGWKGDW